MPVDETYAFTGEDLDTLAIAFEIVDEEAIMEIALDLVEGTTVTPVAAELRQREALSDPGFRAEQVLPDTLQPRAAAGNYSVRLTVRTIRAGRCPGRLRIQHRHRGLLPDQGVLANGDTFVFGQTLRPC